MAMTAPASFEADVATRLGVTNYVPGSLDCAFVNGDGPTTIRFTQTYTIDTTELMTAWNTFLATLQATPTDTTTADPTTQTGTTTTTTS